MARRIYLSTSAAFIEQFEDATSCRYGYLVVDIQSSTSEHDRLQTDVFEITNQHALYEENVSDDGDASSVESLD